MTAAINKWANFLTHDKLDPKLLVDEKDVTVLLSLCERLAATGQEPYPYKGYEHRQTMRRLVVNTAMDMGIDLLKLKRRKGLHGGTKPTIGRGLLDVWNAEYQKRFGSTLGTPGAFEVTRRKVVTKLSEEKRQEATKPENA